MIKKIHKPGTVDAAPLHGMFAATIDGKKCVVEYEPDADLRDTEQVPLLEEGGVEAFLRREVLPETLLAEVRGLILEARRETARRVNAGALADDGDPDQDPTPDELDA